MAIFEHTAIASFGRAWLAGASRPTKKDVKTWQSWRDGAEPFARALGEVLNESILGADWLPAAALLGDDKTYLAVAWRARTEPLGLGAWGVSSQPAATLEFLQGLPNDTSGSIRVALQISLPPRSRLQKKTALGYVEVQEFPTGRLLADAAAIFEPGDKLARSFGGGQGDPLGGTTDWEARHFWHVSTVRVSAEQLADPEKLRALVGPALRKAVAAGQWIAEGDRLERAYATAWKQTDVSGRAADEPIIEAVNKQEVAVPIALNTILYGPPGCGKTRHTAEIAVKICNGQLPPGGYVEVLEEYRKLCVAKRISFVTFHASYSYEDFVEGIRPVLSAGGDDASPAARDGKGEPTQLRYECRRGAFREICARALPPTGSASGPAIDLTGRRIWKMSLGSSAETGIYNECIAGNVIRLGWGDRLNHVAATDKEAIRKKIAKVRPDVPGGDFSVEATHRFRNLMKVGDLVVVSKGNLNFRAIGEVTGDYVHDAAREDDYDQTRQVKWLVKWDTEKPADQILKGGTQFMQQSIYELKEPTLNVKALQAFVQRDDESQNFVMIIDEINRGNLAKIFGELITLLEPPRRLGAEEETRVELPYSQEPAFGIPANLYIIGTMNTADRSIALMDYALRRRFQFKYIGPDFDMFSSSDWDEKHRNGAEVFAALNRQIGLRKGRDYQLGHSYLIAALESVPAGSAVAIQEAAVGRCFREQVVPMLLEYFYEDWPALEAILGEKLVLTSAGENDDAFEHGALNPSLEDDSGNHDRDIYTELRRHLRVDQTLSA